MSQYVVSSVILSLIHHKAYPWSVFSDDAFAEQENLNQTDQLTKCFEQLLKQEARICIQRPPGNLFLTVPMRCHSITCTLSEM